MPFGLLALGIISFAAVVLDTIFLQRRPWLVLDVEGLREKAFARLWKNYGSMLSQDAPPQIERLLPSIQGIVLDLGPGTGEQLARFGSPDAKMIYGAEPAVDLHPKLSEAVRRCNLEGKYQILACGAQQESLIPALAKEGLLKDGASSGVFDDIVCVRVLCGVPRPEETTAGLYRLLKPGGRLILFEHVQNPGKAPRGSLMGHLAQRLCTLAGWSFWLGNCHLERDTAKTIRDAGGANGWSKEDIEVLDPWSPLPHVVGTFTKAA